ncbi:nucleoside hydrolase [Nesterenkonia cremea]|uniref:nucleoside hydrolase n=1 Tax=Nesterenkonia cremea TaxID=1882340 RepID=UPI0016636E5B|nr:nucleoside hydrolase [Nesterenkonia cremea]
MAAVHDALCIAYLLDPEVLELHRMHVAAEIAPGASFGRTIMDLRGRSSQNPNARVALNADRTRFFDLLLSSLSRG